MTRKALSKNKEVIASSVSPTFHAEIYGKGKNISLLLSGIRGINSFSENEILLSAKREIISIKGTLLEINVLEFKSIRIIGRIDNISFRDKKAVKNES